MHFDSEEYASARRAHYNEIMANGEFEYRAILDGLRQLGLPAEFIQTGGMNAAIKCQLENGQYLLITDAVDALSWTRDEQVGWGVGVYSLNENESNVCEAFVETERATFEDLSRALELVFAELNPFYSETHE